MKFILLVYNDPAALESLPAGDFDNKMRHCLAHADELKHNGRLIESQMLEDGSTAKSVRIRNGKQTTLDGPRTISMRSTLSVLRVDQSKNPPGWFMGTPSINTFV